MNNKQLIIFLIPPEKLVNGGIMSIFSLANETRKIKKNAKVVISTYVGFPSYKKNDLFENNEYIYDFDEIVSKFKGAKDVLIHVPELAVRKLHLKLPNYSSFLEELETLSINVLNQNILYMPGEEDIFRLFEFTTNLSQTTAHERYSTQEVSNRFLLPLKHLSVFIDSSSYKKIDYANKENLIAYSPDFHPKKAEIIKMLTEQLPNYSFKEIRDLKYEEYKKVMQKAKYTLTFGEGLDGYFIESTFSGGIPIAVYNDSFFPENSSLSKLPTLYSSYDELGEKVVAAIQRIDHEKEFLKINAFAYEELKKIYDISIYRQKIADFYGGKFDFTPSYDPKIREINTLFSQFLQEKRETEAKLAHSAHRLQLHKEALEKRIAIIEGIEKSKTYKITKKIAVLANKFKLN